MVAKANPAPRKARRWFWLMIVAVVIALCYTVGWFYLASLAKERAQNELTRSTAQGVDFLQCRSLSAHGYPFSLYIKCSDAIVQDARQNLLLTNESLSIGASLFSFKTIRSQLTGPANITLSGVPLLQANWNSLTTATQISGQTAQNIHLGANELHVEIQQEATSAQTRAAGIEMLELKFDLNSLIEPLKSKTTFEKLRFTGDTSLNALPELDGMIDISSEDSLVSLAGDAGSGSVLRGKSLQINQMLFLLPSGASVALSGPASVDPEGRANADLKIRLTNPAAIGSALQAAFPSQEKNIKTIVFALGSMPKDDRGATIVPFVIRNGKASAGFIPLGRLPLL